MSQLSSESSEGIITKPIPRSVEATVSRLMQLIDDEGVTLFTVIDHSSEAEHAGLHMLDTKLVIFGSPAAASLSKTDGTAPDVTCSRLHGKQLPRVGHTFELVGAAVSEGEPRTSDEIDDCA